MKTRLSIFLILFAFLTSINAQENSAPVEVVVTDMDGKARSGEKIIFIGEKSKKSFSGVSDQSGAFLLSLPAGDIYQIEISTIGDDLEYSTFEIPALNPGEYFSGNIVLSIQFEPAKVFTLDNVHFDTGKSTIRPSSFTELNELYEYLSLKEEVRVEIAGHTDDVGDDNANLLLSQNRAKAVKAYLVRKGIDTSRIETVGFGETKPLAVNTTPEGRQRNRRTEVSIISE